MLPVSFAGKSVSTTSPRLRWIPVNSGRRPRTERMSRRSASREGGLPEFPSTVQARLDRVFNLRPTSIESNILIASSGPPQLRWSDSGDNPDPTSPVGSGNSGHCFPEILATSVC